jgi:hypothetical protein
MNRQRLFIVSLPRSGSTVLTTMLDHYEDFLCLPESYFPALLESATPEDLASPDRIAGLFLASCLDGSPLTFQEARECFRTTKADTLVAVENLVAAKFGRNPDSIRVVVWKYTRFVGGLPDFKQWNGKFVILERNPLNVFESQFRVHFGEKNRSTTRFALFETSYKAAFRSYPSTHTLRIDYPNLPYAVQTIVDWVESDGAKRQETGMGLGDHSGKNPWHSEINKPFKNTDPEKLHSISVTQKVTYLLASSIFCCLPWVGSISRKMADRREYCAASQRADAVIP